MMWALAAPLAFSQPGKKPRVAVLDFNYATVRSNVQAMFGTDTDIGKGITDILVDKLVGGNFSVIERQKIDSIIREQNFSNSDRVNADTAARIGRVLGVDAIIVGSITRFGRDDKQTSYGGGVLGRVTDKYGLGGVGQKSSSAVVTINARLINVETGEVMATAAGDGSSKRSGTSLLGAGGGSVVAGGGMDMKSSNFATTIIGEAVNDAVSKLARDLNQKSMAVTPKSVNLEGLVAYAKNGKVVINIGSAMGVKVGDTFRVARIGETIKDPATGKILRQETTDLGTITITDVDEKSAGARANSASAIQVNDVVRP
jgi:curli biogenesis system outer membrane secretion channel CsgG